MLSVLWLAFASLPRLFSNRRYLVFENLVLRHQLTVLKRRHPRPALNLFDKLFWVAISRLWSQWKQSIIMVTPETVVRWHRAGFRMYWRLIPRVRGPFGRRPTPKELRELIFRMVAENPTWGAPRIHGELLMLGFDISERTISRWMKRAPREPEPGKRWLAFLRNHQEAIAAMDFFTVPTISFGVLYCFFVMAHDRRRVLHCNVTKHPTSQWVVQQLREAFPFGSVPRFLIFDPALRHPVLPWTLERGLHRLNPEGSTGTGSTAWRFPLPCVHRSNVIQQLPPTAFERHLRRLLFDYVRYHHEDRTHLGLGKGTPAGRICSANAGRVISQDRLGGLHHRYDRAA